MKEFKRYVGNVETETVKLLTKVCIVEEECFLKKFDRLEYEENSLTQLKLYKEKERELKAIFFERYLDPLIEVTGSVDYLGNKIIYKAKFNAPYITNSLLSNATKDYNTEHCKNKKLVAELQNKNKIISFIKTNKLLKFYLMLFHCNVYEQIINEGKRLLA